MLPAQKKSRIRYFLPFGWRREIVVQRAYYEVGTVPKWKALKRAGMQVFSDRRDIVVKRSATLQDLQPQLQSQA
jgi:hypothetical protein